MKTRSLIKNGFLLSIFVLTIVITFNTISPPTQVDPLAEVNIDGLKNVFYRSLASTGGIANPPYNYLADAKTSLMGYNVGTIGKISQDELQQVANNFLQQVTTSNGYDLYTFYDEHQTLESLFWGHQLKTILFPKQKTDSDQDHEIRMKIAETATDTYRKFGSFAYNFEELYFITKLYSQIDEFEGLVSPILLKFYVYEWLDNKEENITISDIYYALESLKILKEEGKEVEVSFFLSKPLVYRVKKELLDPKKLAKLSNNDIYQRLVILEEGNANNLDLITSRLRPIVLERQDETGGFCDKVNSYKKDEGSIEATYWALQILQKLPGEEIPGEESFFERLFKTAYQLVIHPFSTKTKEEEKSSSPVKVPRLLGENSIQEDESMIIQKIPAKIMATAPGITEVYLNGSTVTEGETIDVNQGEMFTLEISSSDDITDSKNLSVSLDIQIPLDEIEIAIFNTSYSYWLSVSTQTSIASTIIANVPAKNITCYNYDEQDQLRTWMESKLEDQNPDVLVIFDYAPFDLWQGENEDSLLELWMETGNAIITTGYQPFYQFISSTGSTYSYSNRLQYFVDASGSRKDNMGQDNFNQYLTSVGQRYLPSMGSVGQYLYYGDGCTHYKALDPHQDPWEWAARFTKYTDGQHPFCDSYVLEHKPSGGTFAQFYINSDNNLPRGDVISEYLNNWYTTNVLSRFAAQTRQFFGDLAIFNSSSNSGWMNILEESSISDYLKDNYHGKVECFNYSQQSNLQIWIQNRLNDERNDLIVIFDHAPQVLFAGEGDNSLAEQWLEAGNSLIWTGYDPFHYYITSTGGISGGYYYGLQYILDGRDSLTNYDRDQYLTPLGMKYLPSMGTTVGEHIYYGYGAGHVNNYGVEWGFPISFTHSLTDTCPCSDSYSLRHKNGGIYAQFYIRQDSTLPRAAVFNEFIQNWPYIENHFVNTTPIESSHPYSGSEYNIVNITHARNIRFHFDNLTLGSGDNVSFFDQSGSLLDYISNSGTDFWTPWFPTSYINISLLADAAGFGDGYIIDCIEVNRNGIFLYNPSNSRHWLDINFFDESLTGNFTAIVTVTDGENLNDTFSFDLNVQFQGPTISSSELSTQSIFKYNETLLVRVDASDPQDGQNIDVWASFIEPYSYRSIKLPLTWDGSTWFEGTIKFNKTDLIGNWTVTFHARDSDWLTPPDQDFHSTILTVKGHSPTIGSVYLNGTLVTGQFINLTQGGNFNITGVVFDWPDNMDDLKLDIIFQSIPDIAIFNSSLTSGWVLINERINIVNYILENGAYKSALVVDYNQQNSLVNWISANLYDGEDDILIIMDQIPALIYNTEHDESLAEKWLENGNTIIYTGYYPFSQIVFVSGDIRTDIYGFTDIFDVNNQDFGRSWSSIETSTSFGEYIFNQNIQYNARGEIRRGYLPADWIYELPLTSREGNFEYSGSFVLTHANGGHYVQLFITDEVVPRKTAITNYIHKYHISNSIEDTIIIPSHLPDVAVFNASHNSFISETQRIKIISHLIANLTANSINIFNYSEQLDLLSWMQPRLNDHFQDILILLDVTPELIWKGEEDGSIAEDWLENGNMIIFMGVSAFNHYVDLTGSISSASNGFHNVLDTSSQTGTEPYYCKPSLLGSKYLPSLPSDYRSSGAVYPFYVIGDWWISSVFSQEDQYWTDHRLDSFVLNHRNGGSYVQLITSSNQQVFNQINGGSLIEEFVENWLYRSYLHTTVNYTSLETDHPYTNSDTDIVNCTDSNTLKIRLHFDTLTFAVNDFLLISDKFGNIIANYTDNRVNYWTPWFNLDYINITLISNTGGGWGYEIDQIETVVIPRLDYSASTGEFEVNLTLAKNKLLGNRSILILVENYDQLEDTSSFNYTGISQAPEVYANGVNATQLFRLNQTLELWTSVADTSNTVIVALLVAPNGSQIAIILKEEAALYFRGTVTFNETDSLGEWKIIFTGYVGHHWLPWSECGYSTFELLGHNPELLEIINNDTIIDIGTTITAEQDEFLELQFNITDKDSDISEMDLSFDIGLKEPVQVLIFNSSNSNGWMSLEERAEISSYMVSNLENAIITFLDYDQQDIFVEWMTERLNNGVNDLIIFMDQVPSDVWAYEQDGSLAEQWLEAGNSIIWTGYYPFNIYISPSGSVSSSGTRLNYVIDGTTSSLGSYSYWNIPSENMSTILPSLKSYYGQGNSHIDQTSWLGSEWATRIQFSEYVSNPRYSDSHVLQHDSGGFYIQLQISNDDYLNRYRVIEEFIENWFVYEVSTPIMKTVQLPDIAIFNSTYNVYLDQSERNFITSYLSENLTANSIEFFGHQQQNSLETWISKRINDNKLDIIILLDAAPAILYHGERDQHLSLAENWMDQGNMIIWMGYWPFYRYITSQGSVSDEYSSLYYILDGSDGNMGRYGTQQYLTSQGAKYIPSLGTTVGSSLFSSGGCTYRPNLRNDWEWDAIFSQSSDGFYYDNFVLKGSRGGYYAQFFTTSTNGLNFPQVIEEFIENYYYSQIAHITTNNSMIRTPHNYFSSFTEIFNASDVIAMRFHFNNVTLATGDNVSFINNFGSLLGNISTDVTDYWTPWFYTNYINLTLFSTIGNAWGFEIDQWQMRYLPIVRYNSTNDRFTFRIFVDENYWIGNKNITLLIKDSEGLKSLLYLDLEVLQQGPFIHNASVDTLELFKRNETLTLIVNVSDNEDSASQLTVTAYLTDPFGNVTTLQLSWIGGPIFEGSYVFPEWAPVGNWMVTFNATDTEGYSTPGIPEQTWQFNILVKGYPATIHEVIINDTSYQENEVVIVLQDSFVKIQVNATTDQYIENSTLFLEFNQAHQFPDIAIFASSSSNSPQYLPYLMRVEIAEYLANNLNTSSVTIFDYFSQFALVSWMTERMNNNKPNILIVLEHAPEQIFWDNSYAEQWIEAGNVLFYTGSNSWANYVTTGGGTNYWYDYMLRDILDLSSFPNTGGYTMYSTSIGEQDLPSLPSSWYASWTRNLYYISGSWTIYKVFGNYSSGSNIYSDSFAIQHTSGGIFAQIFTTSSDPSNFPYTAVIEEFLESCVENLSFKTFWNISTEPLPTPELAIFASTLSGSYVYISITERQNIVNYLKEKLSFLNVQEYDYDEQTSLEVWMNNRLNNGINDILLVIDTCPENIFWNNELAEIWLDNGNTLLYTGIRPWQYYVTETGLFSNSQQLDDILDLSGMDNYWYYTVTSQNHPDLPSMTSSWYSYGSKRLSYIIGDWEIADVFAQYWDGSYNYSDSFAIKSDSSDSYYAQFYCNEDESFPRAEVIEEFINNWLLPKVYYLPDYGYTISNRSGQTSGSGTDDFSIIISESNCSRIRFYFSELDLKLGQNLTIKDSNGLVRLFYNSSDSNVDFYSPWIYYSDWFNISILRNGVDSNGFNITEYQADIIPHFYWNESAELFEIIIKMPNKHSWINSFLVNASIMDIYNQTDNISFWFKIIQQGPCIYDASVSTIELFKRNETITFSADVSDNLDDPTQITVIAYLTDPYGNVTALELVWNSGSQLFEKVYVFPDWAHIGNWTVSFNATDSEGYWTPAIPGQIFIHFIQVNGFLPEINAIFINTDPVDDPTIIIQDQLSLLQVNASTDYYTGDSTITLNLYQACSIPDVAIFASSSPEFPTYLTITERNAITTYLNDYLNATIVTIFDYTNQPALIAWMTERMNNNLINILIVLELAPEQIFWNDGYAEQWIESGNALIYTGSRPWGSYVNTGGGTNYWYDELHNLLDLPYGINNNYPNTQTPTVAASTWVPSMDSSWFSDWNKRLDYVTNEWSVEEVFAQYWDGNYNYSDAFVLKHSSGGYYAQFYCTGDGSVPRAEVIQEFLQYLPLGDHLRLVDTIRSGELKIPEVAIFCPTVTGPGYITISERKTIANYLQANLDSQEIVVFDYTEQPELISWMNNRMNNGRSEILIILEIAPEQIFWDNSYAEQWLEAGNVLIYTGSMPWASYVNSGGGVGWWSYRLDEILDLAGMDNYWGYTMTPTAAGNVWLPSMDSSWYSDFSKRLDYVTNEWSVDEVFAQYWDGTYNYSDAFVLKHSSGGYYAQFYCRGDDNLPRETVIDEFLEKWLRSRVYTLPTYGYTHTNTSEWNSGFSDENTSVILSQPNGFKIRLFFSDLELLTGHNLTILDQNGNILLEYNDINSGTNFWTPWIFFNGWLNVSLTRNSTSYGFNITKYEVEVYPRFQWNSTSELFETHILFPHDFWNGTYTFEVIFQDIYGRNDSHVFNVAFDGIIDHIWVDIPSTCIRAAPQYFNLTVTDFTLLNPDELLVEFSVQNTATLDWTYQSAEAISGTDFIATYLFEVILHPIGFYDVYVNVTTLDGLSTTYFYVGTFEMINAAPFIHDLTYSALYIDINEIQDFTLNTSDAEDTKDQLTIDAYLILPSGAQQDIYFVYDGMNFFIEAFDFSTYDPTGVGPFGKVFIYINVTDYDGATSYYQHWFVYGSIPANISLVSILDSYDNPVDESLGSYPFSVLVEVYDPDNTTHTDLSIYAITANGTELNLPLTLDTIYGNYTNYTADFTSLPSFVVDDEEIRLAAYVSDGYTISNTNGSFDVYIPTILSPINHSATNQDPVLLVWNGNEPLTTLSHFAVYVDGVWDHTLTLSGGIINQTSVTLNQGMYNITLYAFDQFGKNLSSTINVTIDRIQPFLTILDPVPMFNTTTATVLVNWTASDDYAGLTNFTLTYRTINISLEASTVQYALSLDEGRYDLYLTAWDKAGNSNTSIITLTRDTTQPSVNIDHPLNNSFLNTSSLLIQWTGLDYETGIHHYEVYVDTAFIGSFQAANTSYLHDFADGLHNTTIIAYDYMGWSVMTKNFFYIDTQPPSLSVSSTVMNYYTSNTTYFFTWAASDAVGDVTVYLFLDLSNQSTILTSSPTNVSLTAGYHTIEVVAIDQAQNENRRSFWVFVDITNPVVSAIRAVTDSTTSVYSWFASDDESGLNKTDVYVEGSLYDTQEGSNTSVLFTSFSEGHYLVLITVYNNAGLSTSVTIDYIVDLTPPQLQVSGISDDDALDGEISISCTVDDVTFTNISISIGSRNFYPNTWDYSDAEFLIDTTLISDGYYTLSVLVTDEAGHETVEDYEIAIDNDAASINSIEHSPTGPTRDDEVTISVTISDAVGIDESSVTLYWKLASEDDWQIITMTLVKERNDEWDFEAVIPPQAQGEEIIYYVSVTDLKGRITDSEEENYFVEEVPPDVVGPLIGLVVILGILGALAGSGIFFGPKFLKPMLQKRLEKTQEVKVKETKTRIDDLFDFELDE